MAIKDNTERGLKMKVLCQQSDGCWVAADYHPRQTYDGYCDHRGYSHYPSEEAALRAVLMMIESGELSGSAGAVKER